MVDELAKGMAWMPNQPRYSIVAFIPARSGSKRIPNKNIRPLGDKPLLAWTIEAAQKSGIFSTITVSSDSEDYAKVAEAYGAGFILRPASMAQDDSPDIRWVEHALTGLSADAFAILRPTSPFRTPGSIAQAWSRFLEGQPADSLRAVRPVREHPGKMWILRGNRMMPLLPFCGSEAPWHSMPSQALPLMCVQTASLEIAWARTITEHGTISGTAIIPFAQVGWEGFDLNTEDDWQRAERHCRGEE